MTTTPNTTASGAADPVTVIACALAELDGYNPEEQHCGLYDLRWSGGLCPEPAGDAWNMDYLPKAEKIAKALAASAPVAPTKMPIPPSPADPLDVVYVEGWNAACEAFFGGKPPADALVITVTVAAPVAPAPQPAAPKKKPLPDLMMAAYHEAIGWNACVDAMNVAAAPKAAPGDALDEAMRERDDAEDFINELLDEVLGVDRPEWSSAYNRYDAMNDVRERITALHKPAADKAWGRFGSATAEPKPSPAAQGDALSDAVRVPLNSLHADAAYLIGRLRDGSMPYARVIEIIRERIDAASPTAQAAPAAGAVAGSDDLSGTLRRLDSKELAAWVDRGMALSENLAMYVQADCTLRESQARDMLRAHLFSAQPAPAAPTSPAKAAESVLEDAAPAQPVAWLVYLPSIDTQNVYDSQDDPGYVDDVTNHADAEVTPLYEMAAPKAEVEPAGEYPPLPAKQALYVFKGKDGEREEVHGYDELQMWGFVDADRAMRAQAAHAAVAGQCEDAIELLGKYKELCEEIKRGDSYHIGRIDAAISVLAQAAPQPAVQQGAGTRQEPVAWQSRTRPTWGSNTTPWYPWEICTKEQAEDYWKTPLLHGWAYEARALCIAPQAAPVAQGDALAYEQQVAIRQGHEIAASDSYFDARPQIDNNDRLKVFEAGFERGWDAARAQAKEG